MKSLPFILGFKVKFVSRALAVILVLEAFWAWSWWMSTLNIGYIIHAREHFVVNVVTIQSDFFVVVICYFFPSQFFCVSKICFLKRFFYTQQGTAGGILLLDYIGAGKYTVDELLKKKD